MGKNKNQELFREELLAWHRAIDRDMPWKKTRDAYKIWISEIILQQTRVRQGRVYYMNFLKSFPTIQHLANASEDEVLSAWKGLGYYARARNLHIASRQVVTDYDGVFPNNYNDIISLKGIGKYTAAAISSFAFDLPYAVVDGNVFRVLSRFFGIDLAIDTSEGKKTFERIAEACLLKEDSASYNQAIMDFGALQCTPLSPSCSSCPLSTECLALKRKKVDQLPVKAKRIKIRNRFFNFFILQLNNKVLVEKRKAQDIWKGLYQFPLIETSEDPDLKILTSFLKEEFGLGEQSFEPVRLGELRQRLTHQMIHANFYKVKVEEGIINGTWKSLDELEKLACPKIIQEFINITL